MPAGILKLFRQPRLCFKVLDTDFNMKIHLHVVFAVIAPPIKGPVENEVTEITAMNAVYLGNAEGGTASEIMTIGRLKAPAPASPCKARRIILEQIFSQRTLHGGS